MRFFLFLLLFTSFSAFPDNYSWDGASPSDGSTVSFPDPITACLSTSSWTFHVSSGNGYVVVSATAVINVGDSVVAACTVTMNRPDGSSFYSYPSSSRSGTSCPAGTTYNSQTGVCGSPDNKCAILANTPVPHWSWQSSSSSAADTISINGCEATVTGVSICTNTTKGQYVCTGTATLTGNPLVGSPVGSASTCSGPDCMANAPQPTDTNQDCNYSPSTGGKSTCTAVSSQSDPGTTSCGIVNGAWQCIENPKSTSTDSTLTSTKTDTSNPDGTVTETKDNNLDVDSCNGVKNCTSSSSTSTTTTTTDSSGKVSSSTSTCTGVNCSASSGETNGAGTKGNTGDPNVDSGGPTVSTLTKPTQGSFDGQGDAWDSKIDQAKSDLKDAVDKLKTSFQPVGDISLSAGAKLYCPPPVTVLDHSISFCIDQFADSLNWIAEAIYAVCAVIALFIVFA